MIQIYTMTHDDNLTVNNYVAVLLSVPVGTYVPCSMFVHVELIIVILLNLPLCYTMMDIYSSSLQTTC